MTRSIARVVLRSLQVDNKGIERTQSSCDLEGSLLMLRLVRAGMHEILPTKFYILRCTRRV